jgi:catechol 2,3-dioxygenase-like lactoylglutathione lyase family enzyme
MRLHHVQVSCPPGGEDPARRFYADLLGLTEVPKPTALAGRGGCWFRAHDDRGEVTAEVHIGVEEPFAPARRAHLALVLGDVDALDRLAARLRAADHMVDRSERDTFVGYQRFHTFDPHGNRVELLAPVGRTAG